MGIFSDEKYRPSESRILATALTFSAGFKESSLANLEYTSCNIYYVK